MSAGPLTAGDFLLEVVGSFGEEQVRTEWTDVSRPTNEEIEALIADAWQRRVEAARRTGALCFPGPLCRLAGWRVSDGVLKLTLGPTNYRDMIGTNESHPELAERFGTAYLSDGLAACCVLVSVEGDIVLGRRNARVAGSGLLHVCAGHVEPVGHEGMDGMPSPFVTVRTEAEEEIGLSADDVMGLVCTGLARALPSRKPELAFTATTLLRTAELRERFVGGGSEGEHAEGMAMRNEPDELLGFLRARRHEIAAAGQSTLVLHGAWAFGNDWLQEALRALGEA